MSDGTASTMPSWPVWQLGDMAAQDGAAIEEESWEAVLVKAVVTKEEVEVTATWLLVT